MYIYIYIYIHTHTHTHIYTCIYMVRCPYLDEGLTNTANATPFVHSSSR